MLMTTLSPFEPPRTRVIKKESKGKALKEVLLFLLKCLVFAMVFWSVWIFAMRPLSAVVSGSSEAQSGQDAQQETLLRKYREQARATDELQAKYQQQVIESEKLLARQEALVSRFEAVIQRWEDQAGTKK